MRKINMRDFYPEIYKEDKILEVNDEVAIFLQETLRKEAALQRKMYRYRAFYSLDREDGIENEAIKELLSPEEIVVNRMLREQLYIAISELPDKQAKRIYAHFILGMSMTEIANAEGVTKARISQSIKFGLYNLLQKLKKIYR